MLTTCPECRTSFRLTQIQLETRRGMVRCGYCRAVFNAYDTLLPEFESPVGAPESPPAEVEHVQDVPSVSVAAIEMRRVEPELAAYMSDVPLSDPDDHAQASGDDFILSLSGHVESSPPSFPELAEVEPPNVEERPEDILLAELPTRAQIEPGRRAGRTALLAVASLFLALLLLGQIAYFLRAPLLASWPGLRPAYVEACAALGCRIPLSADSGAIRVESSSLETDPEQLSRAMLRVSLGNRSALPQQWPHLVLKLTDWKGTPLAQRGFGPADYLDATTDVAAGMVARSEREFRLDLDLSGLGATGYEVYPRYP